MKRIEAKGKVNAWKKAFWDLTIPARSWGLGDGLVSWGRWDRGATSHRMTSNPYSVAPMPRLLRSRGYESDLGSPRRPPWFAIPSRSGRREPPPPTTRRLRSVASPCSRSCSTRSANQFIHFPYVFLDPTKGRRGHINERLWWGSRAASRKA